MMGEYDAGYENCIGSMVRQMEDMQFRIDSLHRENAKLRELVWDMWNGMCGYAHDCRSCERYKLYEGQRFVGECEYHRRMRELGVDDG